MMSPTGRDPFEVAVPGGSVRGECSGAGPRLLVLHGGPGLSDYSAMFLDELDGWRVARYTQRGPEPSASAGPFTVDRHVQDALAVLDGLDLPDTVVLGHSWGGFLACALAAAAPDRVRGLVLVDPLGVTGDGGLAEFGATLGAVTERALPHEDRVRAAALDAELEAGRSADPDADFLESFRLTWPVYHADPSRPAPFPAGVRASYSAYVQTFASVVADLAAGTTAGGLSRYTGPVEIVCGAASALPQCSARDTAALLPGAEVVEVPEAGHYGWFEQPGCVRAALDRLRARRA